MSILDEAIKPDPSGKIKLVEADGAAFGAEVLRFHYTPIPHTPDESIAAGDEVTKLTPKSIWWNGLEFGLWPFSVEGMKLTTEQQQDPTLTVGNLSGIVSSMCNSFGDLADAKVRIIETYAKFLDARNFPNGNPSADPNEAWIQAFFIDSKGYGDDETVRFNLGNPADLTGLMIPTRQITSYCTWSARGQYRKSPCNYAGTAYFDEKGNPVQDPALDKCGGCLQDCIKRVGAGKANPNSAVLPFGGFPAAQLIQR